MDPKLKRILRAVSLEIRRLFEGRYDEDGHWLGGDLERRLNEIGIWREANRQPKPLDELPHLSAEDKAARRLVDGYLKLRDEAGVPRGEAVAEFVREAAYTWANRLFALRCMEARGLIDEVILQKDAYGGRSMVHSRFARKNPGACASDDDGLYAVLAAEFAERARELPALFNPKSPAIALRPSVAALKRAIALLSGREAARGQDAATDDVFAAPDAFGWAYQYWNADEKDRVFEKVRTQKGAKIEGADIIPATQLYTEPYMVKFLVQNSLGALWMGMNPDSRLCDPWEYYVKDADRAPVTLKPVRDITFLDPAEGSGHFQLEAFDLFYAMYAEEAAQAGRAVTPREICAAILNHNLFGIDIDERAVQIATAALWMKAKEKAPDLEAGDLTTFHEHHVATNIRLPRGRDHLELFLRKHPEDHELRPALELVFQGLEHADELGSLLQIQQLVEGTLRHLKEESDRAKGEAVEQDLFRPTPIQGALPLGLQDYDQWSRDVLARLHAHLEAEAQAADPVQAFFGESAGKGLAFFSLLSRRYDVVAANPPYMGGNMGELLKAYVTRHFTPGKRDLYAAFILRCIEFALPAGRVAMVTQQSWMFLRSFAEIRSAVPERMERPLGNAFRGVLGETAVEALAHLGEHAFEDSSAAGAFATVFVLAKGEPSPGHRVTAFRVIGPKSPAQKDVLLCDAVASLGRDMVHAVVSRPLQLRFLGIPQTPLCYWLRERFFQLLEPVQDVPRIRTSEGLGTRNDPRFLRFVWEAPPTPRWCRYAKGGGYAKWAGNDFWTVEWDVDGARVKAYIREHYPPEKFTLLVRHEYLFEKVRLIYSTAGRGSLGVRWADFAIPGDAGPALFVDPIDEFAAAAFLNGRPSSYLIRGLIAGGINLKGFYVALLPLHVCSGFVPTLKRIAESCIRAKQLVVSLNPTERSFHFRVISKAGTLSDGMAILHWIEGFNDRLTAEICGLSGEDVGDVVAETGSPAGWFPLVTGYDALPPVPTGLPELPREVLVSLESHERRLFAHAELEGLKRRLRLLHEAGPGGSATEDESDASTGENEEEERMLATGASLPIPPETFIEELSQKLEVHPISVYWLLKEGIEREGWRCPPEERRLTEDRFTVLVLRLLGHRWPRQIEAGEPLPAWADRDGVIPLGASRAEQGLLARVRERIAEEFPGGNVASIEREFEEMVGVSLEKWLAGPFFERHISQFKKRPIAWQIETAPSRPAAGRVSKGNKKRAGSGQPVFACLVYYHKLDADLLPKIRTQYVGTLRSGFETELRTLERQENRTGDQQTRKLHLDQWIEELKAFDHRLEQVSLEGFGPAALRPVLRQYGINDALLTLAACWLRRLESVVKGQTVGHPGEGFSLTRPSATLSPTEADSPAEGASGVIPGSVLDKWMNRAADTMLHRDLPVWVGDAFTHLDHFCATVGPKPPTEKTIPEDPTSADLAALVCAHPAQTVEQVLSLACERWWKRFEETALDPLKQELKRAKEELERLKEELLLDEVKRDYTRQTQLANRRAELKDQVRSLKADIDDKTDRARRLRAEIESWDCPDAATWQSWLGAQHVFDMVASLDGQRPPPATVAEFITQESRYAPDINDGVRVNIAPIQKAGLLHAYVLDSKDADKAIADRAEWRADERRWVREGKLPQPGWWAQREGTT